jgi:hypothetical protein
MSKEIFTPEYIRYCNDRKSALAIFQKERNEWNELIYNSLENQEWSLKEKFTEQYLKDYVEESKGRELTFEEEFNWLMKSCTIDDKALNGQISEITRAEMHKANDLHRENLIRDGRKRL